MKFSLVALAAVVASADAFQKPKLSISVTDGSFDGVDGLDPTLSWSGSSAAGEMDLEYGIEAAARPTTDIASLPKKIFGSLKTNVGGWGVSAGATKDMASGGTDIEVNAANDDADLSVQILASAGGGVESISATKKLDLDGASLSVTPKYDLGSEDADVVVTYDNGSTNVALTASADSQEVVVNHDMGDTKVKLTASKDDQELVLDHTMDNTNIVLTASADNQEVTISQQIDDNNKISPTINRNGAISVAWERDLGDDNSLTATLVPDDSVSVEWKDDNWTANINAGLSGTEIGDVSISAKRDVTF
mmetsp:Transcript_11348/g.26725  ORF Transcript_11348/g.26725 Transcript_11348/m.26725 type:complete len:306 (+) Transcript_11348:128-1045(+)